MTERIAERERAGATGASRSDAAASDVAYADCVLCGEPTEYPQTTKGATLCPVCEWQEGQRLACSG
ncbi:hypothetical protein [Streptomyces sp. NBC_01497]|uniref:hypothetical protein n=1 Tax=Streptomyces sp. NBC_01497 TaxID=2903885 RepID=UPI002E36379B|nr:hypothetical protein [Streptomyces sp. NBC_01497]